MKHHDKQPNNQHTHTHTRAHTHTHTHNTHTHTHTHTRKRAQTNQPNKINNGQPRNYYTTNTNKVLNNDADNKKKQQRVHTDLSPHQTIHNQMHKHAAGGEEGGTTADTYDGNISSPRESNTCVSKRTQRQMTKSAHKADTRVTAITELMK